MKQILHNLKSGEIILEDVPVPLIKRKHVLIETKRSLISPGTERMLVEFGKAGWLEKAKQQPEKVAQVINKIKTDGLIATKETVFAKLDQPIPLGYCNVGTVIDTGEGVNDFTVGDRVVSNGRHAEIVCIPQNLCAKIPPKVDDETATFTVISSIALQGIRLLNPTLGETICVFGLGLIGLLAVKLLQANGVRVIGVELDPEKIAVAKKFCDNIIDLSIGGDPVETSLAATNGMGVDGVLITAATKSNEVIHQASLMCRKRGRIILTGVIGLSLQRSDFYEKELSFQVSCSYGPGRYDPFYETQGNDYPIGFVRWTEQRNFKAILDLMDLGILSVEELITSHIDFQNAVQAYQKVIEHKGLGIILKYSESKDNTKKFDTTVIIKKPLDENTGVQTTHFGLIGAGNFTNIRLLPTLKKAKVNLKWIASAQGYSGSSAAKKFNIQYSTTNYQKIIEDETIKALFITTRHNLHTKIVIECLKQDKHVFVEKPLCITLDEFTHIKQVYENSSQTLSTPPILMVGFNRRYAPSMQYVKNHLQARSGPISLSYTCNAGIIPNSHWVHDPQVGGGRIIGEACHFIDLLQWLVNSPIISVFAQKQIRKETKDNEDSVTICLQFKDGSQGTVHYFSDGSKNYPKEQLMLFFNGKVIVNKNFREVTVHKKSKATKKSFWKQDKGHTQGFLSFVNAVENQLPSPIPIDNIFNTTEATFAAVNSMRTNSVIAIG